MNAYPKEKVQDLSKRLEVDAQFLIECLEESVVEIHETDDHLDLRGGSIFRLRRLQRICHTLNVQPPVAALLTHLLERINDLEKRVWHFPRT